MPSWKQLKMEPEEVNMPDIIHRIGIKAAPRAVYEALATGWRAGGRN